MSLSGCFYQILFVSDLSESRGWWNLATGHGTTVEKAGMKRGPSPEKPRDAWERDEMKGRTEGEKGFRQEAEWYSARDAQLPALIEEVRERMASWRDNATLILDIKKVFVWNCSVKVLGICLTTSEVEKFVVVHIDVTNVQQIRVGACPGESGKRENNFERFTYWRSAVLCCSMMPKRIKMIKLFEPFSFLFFVLLRLFSIWTKQSHVARIEKRETKRARARACVCVCMCICTKEQCNKVEGEGERERERETHTSISMMINMIPSLYSCTMCKRSSFCTLGQSANNHSVIPSKCC